MVNSKSIRNFSIIAHIDHGKSTLADRLLEVTNFKNSNKSFERVLDSLVLEKEKGITIKLNSVQLKYLDLHQKTYIFNLIDTPGHVDFMYEVSRSLAACEGVILLVDSIKGVQAQTIAYYEIAKELGLEIIPVVNKVDLPFARIEEVSEQIINLTKCEKDKIQMVSAKTGLNIENLCESIIKRINPPKVNEDKKSLKALVFDLLYNNYHGVIVYTKIVEGNLKKGQKIKLSNGKKVFKVERIGVKVPNEVLKDDLKTGDIGWFSANIKNMKEIKVGETIMDINSEEKPLDGYKEIKPNVYSNIFPAKSDSFKEFKKSLEELQIQDSSLRMESVDSKLLGPGFRCGFLGLLHREIICERITKEYDCEIITTSPSVNYRVTFQDGEVFETNNPQRLNSSRKVKSIEEIFIEIKITTPEESLGEISNLCQEKRGVYVSQDWKIGSLYQVIYEIPFSEFIIDFHDKVKAISHGYASFSYRIVGYQQSDIEKVDLLLNGELIPDLSFLVHKDFAYERGKKVCAKLKSTLNKQTFSVPIQACIGNNIIARETMPALKKNVTGNMYGGDRTRKMKLWAKQKKGKAKMKELGKVRFESSNLKEILKGSY